jgi:hypothetical protein
VRELQTSEFTVRELQTHESGYFIIFRIRLIKIKKIVSGYDLKNVRSRTTNMGEAKLAIALPRFIKYNKK